jgi:DNA-binding FadR family transcriptional regulator
MRSCSAHFVGLSFFVSGLDGLLSTVGAYSQQLQQWYGLVLEIMGKVTAASGEFSLGKGVRDDQPAVAEVLSRLRELMDVTLASRARRLPSERALALRFGVGRAIVRQALDVLERDGLLVRHVGRGTYIASGAGASSRQLHALVVQGAQAVGDANGPSAKELLEARYALEPAIAELAALAARPEDIQKMRDCLLQREHASNVDDYEHWDYALHQAIADSTHNTVLLELLLLVNRLRLTFQWRQFRRRSINPERKARSDHEHRAIVDAIAQANPTLAFELMRGHVKSVSSRFSPDESSSAVGQTG